ncbi:MAG: prepilin-type N-terminal cleavage/methylation domain-containing protein [Alphaproteobacteria bacterium]|nr:prepilin-type N-terminal cleavage/methylation domain-containing protein [Alphaproteobacteria bacterium]
MNTNRQLEHGMARRGRLSGPRSTVHGPPRKTRRGFNLLEVMVALSILVVSLVILVETQSTAAFATREAERVVTATDLAEAVMAEAQMRVEMEGFSGDGEIFEKGDFDDLGDEALNVEMGDELEDYHWEYAVQEINVALAGDIAQMAQGLSGGAVGGEGNPLDSEALGAAIPGGAGGLGALLSPDMISQMLTPYIRELKVRVWWGDSSDKAEEDGTEVILVTHVINPSGDIANIGAGALPQ